MTINGMASTIPHNPIRLPSTNTPINALSGLIDVLEAVKYGVTKLLSICCTATTTSSASTACPKP